MLSQQMFLISETTGAAQAQASQENSDAATMREIARSEGNSGVVRYIENNIDRWKEESVNFGITGHSSTGKSTFVNLVRDIKEGDVGYARVGRGNTTQSPTPYFHPDNRKIVYWDLPGVATVEFPKIDYIDKVRLQEYDYIFVFFDTVLCEDDLWITQQLIRLRKSFCLVRSKVDLDVKEGTKEGIDEQTVLANLRTKTFLSINKHKALKAHCKIFFISCEKKNIGEIDILFEHIRENLSSIKYEAVMYSLHILSQEIIEEKYKSLKRRVIKASVATAIVAASPIPGIDLIANINILVNEIKHYIAMFGLTDKQIRKISYRDQKQLRCREFFGLRSEKWIRETVEALFIQKYYILFTTLTISDIFLPIVGSIVSSATTATIVNNLLNEILENLQQDAIFVYDLILPLPTRSIRTMQEKFENEGQECINKYIIDVLNRWKEETVIVGVIGEPNTGTIEFINRIRQLKIGNPGFAEENKITTPYYYPNNEGIILIETRLSDFGETILSRSPNKRIFTGYDDFFVFLDGDVYTDDICILHNLTKIEKSFSVIRKKSASKTQDQETILGTGLAWLYLETDFKMLVEKDEEIDSDTLRDIIYSHLYTDNKDEYEFDSNVCVLSCLNIDIGEIDQLINHMIKNLPPAKSEAVINALHPLSKLVIEEKFQSLKRRIVFVTTAATSTTAFHIPNIVFPVNTSVLVDEITHYMKVFGFSDKGRNSSLNKVNKLRCTEFLEPGVVFSDIIHRQIQVLSTEDNIAAIENITDLFVPIAGSIVSSTNNAALVYRCLTGILDDFRHDAFVAYDSLLAESE